MRKHHGVWERKPHYQAAKEINGGREPPAQGSGPTVNKLMGAELGLGGNERNSIRCVMGQASETWSKQCWMAIVRVNDGLMPYKKMTNGDE